MRHVPWDVALFAIGVFSAVANDETGMRVEVSKIDH